MRFLRSELSVVVFVVLLLVAFAVGRSGALEDRPLRAAGVARPGQTPSGKLTRWRESPVRITLDASVVDLDREARDAVVAAFAAWQSAGVPLPEFRFDEAEGLVPAVDDVNAVVLAFIDVPGLENAAAITIAQADASGAIVGADIVLNARYASGVLGGAANVDAGAAPEGAGATARAVPPSRKGRVRRWGGPGALPNVRMHASIPDSDPRCQTTVAAGDACGQRYDIANVMTHEVGHLLGLLDDADDERATMFMCTHRCEQSKRVLAAGDVTAIRALYEGATFHPPPPAPRMRVPACAAAGAVPTRGTPELALGAAAGALVVRWRRRRARRTAHAMQTARQRPEGRRLVGS